MALGRRKNRKAAAAEVAAAEVAAAEVQLPPPDRPWTIYVPAMPDDTHYRPVQPTYEQQQMVGLPYGQDVFPGDPLLVVMSCPAHLLAARLARENGSHVVVWAWLCSETLARQAETEFPVVYGIPTADQVADIAAAGAREQGATSVCIRLESAFRIPEQL